MKHYFILMLLGSSLLLNSCGEDGTTLIDDGCSAQVLCTEEIRYLSYQAMYEGEPVVLDNYYVKNLDNGNVYQDNSLNDHVDEGHYIVVSDAQFSEIKKAGTTLRFFGVKDGEIIIEQDFLVGRDCCHIFPLEGPFDEE